MPTSRDRTGLSPDKTPDWKPDQLRLKPGESILTATLSDGGIAKAPGGMVFSVASVGVPFVVPAGDGGTNGMSFTGGGGGAFTLSAAIQANLATLIDGCYLYLPANAGGSGCVAGFYYAVFSSDIAGTVYGDIYTTGTPTVPASPTTFAGSPAGRITQTTAEVTGPNGYTLSGGAMGPLGEMTLDLHVTGSADAGTKVVRWRAGTDQVYFTSLTTVPSAHQSAVVRNRGVEIKQSVSRPGVGMGGAAVATVLPAQRLSLNTASDLALSVTLQVSANTSSCVLLSAGAKVASWV